MAATCSNLAWPALHEAKVEAGSVERELCPASASRTVSYKLISPPAPVPQPRPAPSSACFSRKGERNIRPVWIRIYGPPVSCTLRTLFKTVPPLWKYWFCSIAKISELATNQLSLWKLNLPSDRFNRRAILSRKSSWYLCACPPVPCLSPVATGHWGGGGVRLLFPGQNQAIVTQKRAREFLLEQAGRDGISVSYWCVFREHL